MIDLVLVDQRPPVLPHHVSRRMEVGVDVVAPRLGVGEARRRRWRVGQTGILAQHRHGVDADPSTPRSNQNVSIRSK